MLGARMYPPGLRFPPKNIYKCKGKDFNLKFKSHFFLIIDLILSKNKESGEKDLDLYLLVKNNGFTPVGIIKMQGKRPKPQVQISSYKNEFSIC